MLETFPWVTPLLRSLSNGVLCAIVYCVFFSSFHYLRIHERFGIFKVREPEVHFRSAMKNWKIPFLWGVGSSLIMTAYGMKFNALMGSNMGFNPQITFSLPPEYIFIHSPNIATDILWGIIAFYLIDFGDYWAHRLGHKSQFMYKRFPFAHFVHHNWTFLNPFVTISSPIIHPVVVTSTGFYVLFLSQGLVVPVLILHFVKFFSNHVSHLGCDPLPWLTRLNHRVGGWIPWIPLHHQYHHLHFARQGNYGNLTCLWDYVFGTIIPDSAYHIENGSPTPEVAARMNKSAEQMESDIGRYLKGRLGLNLG